MASTIQRIIEAALPADKSIEQFICSRRDDGVSWRAIRDEIHEITGIHLGHETIRRWGPKGGDTQ